MWKSPRSSSAPVSSLGAKESLSCLEGLSLKEDRKCRYWSLRYGQVFLRNWSSSEDTATFSSSVWVSRQVNGNGRARTLHLRLQPSEGDAVELLVRRAI